MLGCFVFYEKFFCEVVDVKLSCLNLTLKSTTSSHTKENLMVWDTFIQYRLIGADHNIISADEKCRFLADAATEEGRKVFKYP